jgi:hypothetical protein
MGGIVSQMTNCGFSLCHFFDALLMGMITGILSGLYTAFVSERIQRFYQIRNEALRRIRSIEFILNDSNFKVSRTNVQLGDSQRELRLLTSELDGLGHKRAGAVLRNIANECVSIQTMPFVPSNFNETYSTWQTELREMPPSRWVYYRPW